MVEPEAAGKGFLLVHVIGEVGQEPAPIHEVFPFRLVIWRISGPTGSGRAFGTLRSASASRSTSYWKERFTVLSEYPPMQIKPRAYPHPVLSYFSDDIIGSQFQATVAVKGTKAAYGFEVTAKTSNRDS